MDGADLAVCFIDTIGRHRAIPPIERVRRKGGPDLGQGGGVEQRPWLK